MKNIIMFLLALACVVFYINYTNNSAQVKKQASQSETLINNAAASFLDKVGDSGAITSKNYTQLQTQLMNTGGAFSVTITVTRLYPVPDPNTANSYVMDYRPAYGWTSDQGGISDKYVDPNWQTALYGAAPKGVQYLVKADNVALVIKQTDAMPYQRTMVARLATTANLNTWSYSNSVRNTGNAIVGNQPEPLR
jgi:hypothetical protein